MEDNKDIVTDTVKTEDVEVENKDVVKEVDKEQPKSKTEKTFTRDEVNKMINAEKLKSVDEYKKQQELEKTEAQKLEKMNADEKTQYEFDKIKKEAEDYRRKLASLELKDEATKQIAERKLDVRLLDCFEFEKETAESVKTKMDIFEKTINELANVKLNEKLKQNSPKETKTVKDVNDPYVKGFVEGFK